MAASEVTLLLVGNAGNGKSATGNSILRQQAFETTASTSKTKSEFAVSSSSFKDIKINVVDAPAVETDTKSAEEVLNLSIKNIKEALKLCNNRFSALLIVLKCGARFTKQESEFVKTVKGILGENVIRDFGVCIMTHGDNFEADNEDENLSFEEWCKKQEGGIKNLFQECNYRCVLFNNRTKDESLKDSQVSELIKMIRGNVQYNEDDFKAANADLQKLVMQTKAPNISKEAREFIDTKRREIQHFQPNVDVKEVIRFYEVIKRDVDNKEMSLRREYDNVDSIDKYLVDITVFKLEMESKIRSLLLNKPTEQVQPNSSPLITPLETDRPNYSLLKTPTEQVKPTSYRSITPIEQVKPTSYVSKTPTETDKPSSYRSKSPTEQVKPTSYQSKTPTEQVKPTSYQSKTPTEQVKPTSYRSKTPTEQVKPTSYQSKTPTEQVKPTSYQSKTPTEQVKPTSYQRKTPTEQVKPTSYQSIATTEQVKPKPSQSKNKRNCCSSQ